MKISLLILALGLFATAGWAQDSNTTLSERIKQQQVVPPRKVVIRQKQGEGAVQRGIRTGSPLQMVNVFAPAEYGDGSEFVYYDEYDPFQRTPATKPVAKGIKLFGFTF